MPRRYENRAAYGPWRRPTYPGNRRQPALTHFHPMAFAPIAAPFMLAPAIALALVVGPSPVIRMDNESMLRPDPAMIPYVPAFADPVANDLRRSGGRGQGQDGNSAQDSRCENPHHFLQRVNTCLRNQLMRRPEAFFDAAEPLRLKQAKTRRFR